MGHAMYGRDVKCISNLNQIISREEIPLEKRHRCDENIEIDPK
jgi:hypothetical protein